ncbi:MAG TPA: 4-hydroxythreonine-4-phosphate dehydrogenase PdxA [bacterium]|nr:4-hydroxythreonine-4-phosphate dehydrogenase PdxA [bacterium]
MNPRLPTIALTLGDPSGIGPELIAKLVARNELMRQARVVVVGDRWVWEDGQQVARTRTELHDVASIGEARTWEEPGVPCFFPIETVRRDQVTCATATAAGGASVLRALSACLDAARAGEIDALCFAPLNKLAMKQAGLRHADELHFFAEYLGVRDYVCEINVLEGLWTTRVTSHVPLKDVAAMLRGERIKQSARLLYRSLRAAGVERPRIAVAGLNPHAGEGGTCGREEIDVIAPAVREAAAEGIAMDGPFSADTIFLRALAGQYDGILTMYHDQGQIALKLMGFDRGVTVQGGLPLPVTTPAHGTAFDIAGQNKANVEALSRAFAMAGRMSAIEVS